MNTPVLDSITVPHSEAPQTDLLAQTPAAARGSLAAMVAGAATEASLNAEQQKKVLALAARLESGGLAAVHGFGREIGQHAASNTDQVLERVRSADLEGMGAKLSQIVSCAQGLNLSAMSGKRSGLPLVGGLIDKLRLSAGDFTRKFQDVRTQVDTLVAEVDSMQTGLAERIDFLSEAFDSIKAEHALLQIHIVAGEQAAASMKRRQAGEKSTSTDLLQAQEQQDLRSTIAALDKRVADMKMLQHAALQQLPMIRMVQTNNRMLIEKFHTIRELTVPAWKRQFMMALSLNEQKNAVALANTIDDATNQFLRENARLLKDNTVSTARANQRLVIDVDTLREVHDTLLATVQEVVQINREGVQQRAAATTQLQALRNSMTQQLSLGAK